MNTDKQRIAIAQACGWKDIKDTNHEDVDIESRSIVYWSGLTGVPPEFIHYENRIKIPDYLNDLNAMHEAEKTLTPEYQPAKGESQWSDYLGWLGFCGENKTREVYECVTASAAQRAEAFLRTIGKWEDDK
jgi:hypothetical protein